VGLRDQNKYHTFIPLLYQVSASDVEPAWITCPIRSLVGRSPNIRFLQAKVTGIQPEEKWVSTTEGAIAYDFLIIATGSRARFLGIPGAEQYGFTLRTLDQALRLKHRLLASLQSASLERDDAIRQRLLTVAIVGGGATGVEVAGALQVWFRRTIQRDYPGLDARQAKIIILQSGDRLLPSMPETLGHYAERRLRKQGVRIHLNTIVERLRADGIDLVGGMNLEASTVIWAVGVEAEVACMGQGAATLVPCDEAPGHPTVKQPTFVQAKGGKLRVDRALRVVCCSSDDSSDEVDRCIFAIGDVAYCEQSGRPLAGLATEAMQQGRHVAHMVRRSLRGQEIRAFHYFDKGQLAIIHPGAAVGQVAGVKLKGWLAWMIWLVVHLMVLPGWKNRMLVLVRWMQLYGWGDRPFPSLGMDWGKVFLHHYHRSSVKVTLGHPCRDQEVSTQN
jgi:NADH dehydrogenase